MTAAACLRLDERAGTPPSARRACWTELARVDPSFAEHADARVQALSAETADPLIADAPARLRLEPAPLGRLPAPADGPPASSESECVRRARACDETCAGSAAWATCIGRCDVELGRCLQDRAR